MIKLQQSKDITSFSYNFRCGDVLCLGPSSYNVSCALCGQRLPYDAFPGHFQLEHLKEAPEQELEERQIETENEDLKLFEAEGEVEAAQLDAAVEVELGPLTIKTEDDPIETYDTHKQLHVDLAQIALLDQEQEPGETGSIATRRQRRVAAIKHMLVEHELQLEEAMSGNGDSSPTESTDDDDSRDMLFPCAQCERAYNTKRSLQSHMRSKHQQVQDASAAAKSSRRKQRKDPSKIYKCPEADCNQTFRTERDLRGHRWKHTGIFCDICGKPFTQSGNMMRHRQRHSGIKPYKCQQTDCNATFYTQKELTSHNICHTGRMPCICEICGRPCRDRGVLTAHMRRHTGERPAKCEVCSKAFYSFHDLNVHAVSHTSLRPFVCDVCGSTFQRKKALRVHKLLHSEQRKYSCKLCNKSFAQSGGLNAHMRTHETPRAKAKAKAKSVVLTTPHQVEIVSSEETVLQETVTIELIQEEHPQSQVEVVAVATAAGSWQVT